jgi:hypothetical protein
MMNWHDILTATQKRMQWRDLIYMATENRKWQNEWSVSKTQYCLLRKSNKITRGRLRPEGTITTTIILGLEIKWL